jgi:catechol 2,3-dioxygenase-like lactoylglutathione lyase family enzyme
VIRLTETILRTSQLDVMKPWYRKVLGVDTIFEHNPDVGTRPLDLGGQTRATDLRMCFFRISSDYPFTQMIGIFEEPGTAAGAVKGAAGLHHIQLMTADFEALIGKYEELAQAGLKPHRSTNHGPMTSFYYRDPDGNNIELATQNFPTFEMMTAFMKSDYFQKNPSGIEIGDPDAFVARYRGGVSAVELTRLTD